jgi:coenzyme PQQ precursor peptide PqqA
MPSSRHVACRDAWRRMGRGRSGRTPSLSLPRFAGEGTLAISSVDEGRILPPLPRSGGGLGRGHSPICTPPTIMLRPTPSSNLPRRRTLKSPGEKSRKRPTESQLEEMTMAWTTPVIVEVCVGMEVTSYSSAEI